MRIAIYDDLHIETDGQQAFKLADADVCVLAGDICVASRLPNNMQDADSRGHRAACKRFFARISEKYPQTVYVMGNHEHYRGFFENTATILREFLRPWLNITLLDNEVKVIDGIPFFGGTMWTDCNKSNPLTCLALDNYLNDFHVIKHRENAMRFRPEYSAVLNQIFINDLQDFLRDNVWNKTNPENGPFYDKIVVVTHHCPSRLSLDDRFKHETQGNFGYYSDLDALVDNPAIKVWFHGHVHVAKDYYIGDTRVVCNPRGYKSEIHWNCTGFSEGKVVVI